MRKLTLGLFLRLVVVGETLSAVFSFYLNKDFHSAVVALLLAIVFMLWILDLTLTLIERNKK